MDKNEQFTIRRKSISNLRIVKILLFQIVLFTYFSNNVCSQERSSETPENNQNVTIPDSLTLVLSDSIKIVEAKRIYEKPIQNNVEKKVIINPNQPFTEPKKN